MSEAKKATEKEKLEQEIQASAKKLQLARIKEIQEAQKKIKEICDQYGVELHPVITLGASGVINCDVIIGEKPKTENA